MTYNNLKFEHWKDLPSKKVSRYHGDEPKNERTKILTNLIRKLSKNSKINTVLEPGCNVGRNLKHLKETFGLQIFGLDINQQSINHLKSNLSDISSNFEVSNLYEHGLNNAFSFTEHNRVDCILTMGFLMHLPRSEKKSKLIDDIFRTTNTVIFYELTDLSKKIQKCKNDWYLSHDDYDEYCPAHFEKIKDFKYKHKEANNQLMKIFTFKRK
jgi:SAM-dependent methyltransferase